LDFAIARVGGVDPGVREKLLGAYRRMAAFPEVSRVLAALKQQGAQIAILSNGDPEMLESAVTAAGLDGVFDAVLSITAAGVFKPAMAVYQLVLDRFGGQAGAVTFLSSNRWDIAGAHVFGFKTIWVNRVGAPDEYPDMPAGRTTQNLDVLVSA
jgi:2-haloacid dehalogenase